MTRTASPPVLKVALAMRRDLTPDLMGPSQWRRLTEAACVMERRPIENFTDQSAVPLLGEADVLLTGWGCPQIDSEVLRAAPVLKLVTHTGSSVRPLVSDALWARSIRVSSAAAANAVPVAEFALAAILLANKGVFCAREAYRARRAPARYPWISPGERGNLGATVGIVGASRTGRSLMRLLEAFDVEVLVYDPIANPEEIRALALRAAGLDELAAACDVLTIHAPSLPETRGMIGAPTLALLRDGATVVNTARGDIVDMSALERELVSGRLSAVLDVTDPEPLPPGSPLFDLPNVFLTPHVAGAAGRETRRLADLAIAEIERFAVGEPLRHEVTPAMLATIA